MKSLFFRVFGLLLAAFIVVVLVAFIIFRLISDEFVTDERRIFHHSREAAEDIVEAYEEGRLSGFRQKLNKRFHLRFWLLDSSNRPLAGPPVPPMLMRQIKRFPTIITPPNRRRDGQTIVAHVIIEDGKEYRVVMTARYIAFGWLRFIGLPVLSLLLGLLAAGALLSYWILRPLQAFSRTARSINADNLGPRVDQKITRRKDAFGELGREFNLMAERVAQTLESQRQLLRDVSHELRSPLARIQVAASLSSQKHGVSDELSRIELEVDKLNGLIADLLLMSRLESGQQPERVTLDLSALLGGIAEDASYEFQKSDRKAVLHTQSDCRLDGDPMLLTSVFENVIRNAVRFTPDGSNVEIDILRQGSSLLVTIADLGPGVPDDKLGNIFEPFYRLDDARNPDTRHHGVGLGLAKSIVVAHGGQISAANRQDGNTGLIVRIQLPAS